MYNEVIGACYMISVLSATGPVFLMLQKSYTAAFRSFKKWENTEIAVNLILFI